MTKQPEGKIVRRISKYLKSIGARPFKIWGSDEGFQEVGIPDFLVCYRGRFIGLEVKQPGKKPSKRQAYVMASIREAGGIAETVESVEDVRAIVELCNYEHFRLNR
jgi:hypothetical protein